MTTWAPDPHRRGATTARRSARTWLSLRVELVEGRGERFWPRPGRLLAAARTHTFAQLATAIDDAFARWDRAHLHEFTLTDGQRIGRPDPDFDTTDEALDDRRTTLGRLRAGEQFVYVFDFGDDWTHLCTVGDRRVDPLETLGVLPAGPLPYFGWGDLPDQYGRRWDSADFAWLTRPRHDAACATSGWTSSMYRSTSAARTSDWASSPPTTFFMSPDTAEAVQPGR